MANTGKLALILTADSTGLNKDLDRAEKSLKSFASRTTSIFATAGKIGNLPGAGLGAFLDPIKSFAESVPAIGGSLGGIFGVLSGEKLTETISKVGELNKSSKAYGLTIQEMSGFANVAGLSMDDFGMGLKHLNEQLGAAQIDPTSSAAKSFEKLGLDAEKLASGNGKQAFLAIADQISKIGSHFEKAAISGELFGKKGDDLLPVLNRGAAAIEGQIQRADDLGRVLNEIDAAKILEAGKAMKDLDLAVVGLAQRVAVDLAPVVTALARGMGGAGADKGGWWESLKGGFNSVSDVASDLFTWRPRGESAQIRQLNNEFENAIAQEAAKAKMMADNSEKLSLAEGAWIAAMTKDAERAQKQIDDQRRSVAIGVASSLMGSLGQTTALPTAAEFGSESALNTIANAAQKSTTIEDLVQSLPAMLKDAFDKSEILDTLKELAQKEAGLSVAVLGP